MASRKNKVPLTQKELGKKQKEKNMAEKTMTQVKALEIAVEVLKESATSDEQIEARKVLEGMIAKRKAPRKPRVNKEAEAFRAELLEVLEDAEGPMTNAELMAAINEKLDAEFKPQKIANNMRVLVDNGVVVRIRGEKASDKDTFALA